MSEPRSIRHGACRLFVGVVAGVLTYCAFADGTTAEAPGNETRAKELQTAIDRFDKDEPRSPAALTSRLDYAEFLAQTMGDDCLHRLDYAQSQLDVVAKNPIVEVVLPLGPARIAEIEYRIHVGRASCGGAPSAREQELREALDAAQRATVAYRDALDYRSMVTMQYNVGITYRTLGMNPEALMAIESAIEMDREYGFREDAQDNYRVLLRWKSEPSAADRVAALMRDFPTRSTTMKFAWVASEADVALEIDLARALENEVVESRATRTLERHIRPSAAGWMVSVEPGDTSYDPGVGPNDTDIVKNVMLLFTRSVLELPDIEVSSNGAFRRVIDADGFSARQASNAQALMRSRGAPSDSGSQSVGQFADQAVRAALVPDAIESKAAELYNLETAAWIGARLEQGVWYEMKAPLSMPGTPRGVVLHSLTFAFTHRVPCTPKVERSCIEIVVHAAPDERALDEMLEEVSRAYRLRHVQKLRYSSATYLRIVTDPDTLLPYGLDMRRYAYLSTGERGANGQLIESEKTVSLSTYR